MDRQSTFTVRYRPVTTQIAFFRGIGHVKPTSMAIHTPIYIITDFSAFSAYELYTSSELSQKCKNVEPTYEIARQISG